METSFQHRKNLKFKIRSLYLNFSFITILSKKPASSEVGFIYKNGIIFTVYTYNIIIHQWYENHLS